MPQRQKTVPLKQCKAAGTMQNTVQQLQDVQLFFQNHWGGDLLLACA